MKSVEVLVEAELWKDEVSERSWIQNRGCRADAEAVAVQRRHMWLESKLASNWTAGAIGGT